MLKKFFLNYYYFLLYNIVLVLPYINMHPLWVYTCSPSWTPLPPPFPYHLSGSSQCTNPKLPVSCIEPGLAIHFLYDITCCILSPCLFNLYAEYIMRNAGLEETQAGIKIASRNINNLRYADDTTLMAESEEELRSLLMKVKWWVKKLA